MTNFLFCLNNCFLFIFYKLFCRAFACIPLNCIIKFMNPSIRACWVLLHYAYSISNNVWFTRCSQGYLTIRGVIHSLSYSTMFLQKKCRRQNTPTLSSYADGSTNIKKTKLKLKQTSICCSLSPKVEFGVGNHVLNFLILKKKNEMVILPQPLELLT